MQLIFNQKQFKYSQIDNSVHKINTLSVAAAFKSYGKNTNQLLIQFVSRYFAMNVTFCMCDEIFCH